MKKMQKIPTIVVLIITYVLTSHTFAAPPILGVKIDFSSKAYWDGTKCASRDKGCCIHLEFGPTPEPGHIIGELNFSYTTGLVLTTSRMNGMLSPTYNELFRQGKFIADGEITFDPEVLKKLGLNTDYKISAGSYPFIIKDDLISIVFK